MCKRLTCFVPHLFPCSWQFTLTKHRHSDIHTPGLWLKDKKGVDENVGCVWLKFGGWLKGKLQQTETLSESQLDTFLPVTGRTFSFVPQQLVAVMEFSQLSRLQQSQTCYYWCIDPSSFWSRKNHRDCEIWQGFCSSTGTQPTSWWHEGWKLPCCVIL